MQNSHRMERMHFSESKYTNITEHWTYGHSDRWWNMDTQTHAEHVDTKTHDRHVDIKTDDRHVDTKTDHRHVDTKTDDRHGDTKTDDRHGDTKTHDRHVDTKTHDRHQDRWQTCGHQDRWQTCGHQDRWWTCGHQDRCWTCGHQDRWRTCGQQDMLDVWTAIQMTDMGTSRQIRHKQRGSDTHRHARQAALVAVESGVTASDQSDQCSPHQRHCWLLAWRLIYTANPLHPNQHGHQFWEYGKQTDSFCSARKSIYVYHMIAGKWLSSMVSALEFSFSRKTM